MLNGSHSPKSCANFQTAGSEPRATELPQRRVTVHKLLETDNAIVSSIQIRTRILKGFYLMKSIRKTGFRAICGPSLPVIPEAADWIPTDGSDFLLRRPSESLNIRYLIL